MHRVFNIPELVLLISRGINVIEDLYHFGVTCRGLWSIVEEELWRDVNEWMLYCLVPKVKSRDQLATASTAVQHLCRWIKTAYVTASYEPYYVLSGLPSPIYSDPSQWALGYDVFEDVMLLLCKGPAFHSLRELNIVIYQTRSLYVVGSLLSCLPQAIQILDITLENNSGYYATADLHEFVMCLRDVRLPLEYLHLNCVCSKEDDGTLPIDLCLSLEAAYTTVFEHNTALRSEMQSLLLFGVHDGSRLLPVLSQLPKLSTLDLFLVCDREIAPYAFQQNPFPSLTVASLRSDISTHHPPHIPFFHSLPSSNLQEATFSVDSTEQCSNVLSLLASRWAATLRSISVRIVIHNIGETIVISPMSTILRPLFTLQRLTLLSLLHESCFSLDVEDIRRLVLAFPHLKEVNLGLDYIPFEEEAKRPHTSPRVLSVLAEGLPELEALVLSVDFDLDLGWIPDPQGVSSTVCKLDLEESWCSEPDATAELISSIFPKLTSFTCEGRASMAKVKDILNLNPP